MQFGRGRYDQSGLFGCVALESVCLMASGNGVFQGLQGEKVGDQ